MIAWPAHSPRELLRYPFSPAEFQAVQTWFFVHHLAMVAVMLGFARSGAMGTGRIMRGAAWVAAIGVALLAVNELNAIRYAEWTLHTANAGALGAGYGISTNLVGLGTLVAGIGVLRAKRWTGWHRWVPLAIALVHFVGVTPALFSESFVGARIAIVTWVALFGALGAALISETRRAAASSN
ncbi:MAG TPA: hypothetical protein VMZ53_10875 [Kofleriaceae bacterium]|nr:hypothetical protein [Kofleriaceae bacterium]